jgi:hypothetical protein
MGGGKWKTLPVGLVSMVLNLNPAIWEAIAGTGSSRWFGCEFV